MDARQINRGAAAAEEGVEVAIGKLHDLTVVEAHHRSDALAGGIGDPARGADAIGLTGLVGGADFWIDHLGGD